MCDQFPSNSFLYEQKEVLRKFKFADGCGINEFAHRIPRPATSVPKMSGPIFIRPGDGSEPGRGGSHFRQRPRHPPPRPRSLPQSRSDLLQSPNLQRYFPHMMSEFEFSPNGAVSPCLMMRIVSQGLFSVVGLAHAPAALRFGAASHIRLSEGRNRRAGRPATFSIAGGAEPAQVTSLRKKRMQPHSGECRPFAGVHCEVPLLGKCSAIQCFEFRPHT